MARLCFLLMFVAASALGASNVFRYANGAEPKDLDPHKVVGEIEFHILFNLFDPLLTKDPKTLAPVPAAAEKWTLSKDRKTYTFTMRKGAKWSNGDPVTSQDFLYSWLRVLNPETASEYAYQGYVIKGARDYNTGRQKDASKVGLKAPDVHTFIVELEQPVPYFTSLVAFPYFMPVHKATVEKHGKKWTMAGNMVSNGPFTLSTWEVNKIVKLKKNELYWDAANVKLAEAHFLPTDSVNTAEKMFRAGQVEGIIYLPQELIEKWRKSGDPAYRADPVMSTYYYRVNVTKPPMNDKRVRKALALGFDRNRLLQYVTKGGEKSALALSPPGIGGYEPPKALAPDLSRLAEAKKLLEEAGYGPGKKTLQVEILYNTDERHRKIAEALQQMWKQNLGVEITLQNQEWKVFLNSVKTLSYQVSRMAWAADYNDPNTFLDLHVTSGGNNETGWSNAEYDRLIEQAGKEPDSKKRLALFFKAEELMMDEMPIIPIFVYVKNYLISPKVKGWYSNPEDYHPLKSVEFSS